MEDRGCRSGAPRLLIAGSDQDPAQPGLEAFRIPEFRELAPGSDDRLLNGVLGAVEVAQDALGNREQPVGVRARQHPEGLAVSVSCRLDQFSVQGLALRCATLGRSELCT